jgi:hypothetical protein
MGHIDWLDLWQVGVDIAILAFGASAALWVWLKARRAQSWPSAQGTIGAVYSHADGHRYVKPWVSEFIYTYIVNGEYYSGRHLKRAWSESRAEESGLGWKGRMIVVRYSPAKHEVSVLLDADQPGGQLGN